MRHTPTTLFIGLLAACAETVNRPPPPPVDWQSFQVQPAPDGGAPKATERERAVAALYTQALASPGFGQLSSMLDEDAHFTLGDKDTRGRDRVLKAHEELFGAFDERKSAATRVFRTDRSQTVEWTVSGVQARPWMGIGATQKQVVFKGVTLLWTNDDGSLSDVHVFFDPAVVKGQLGVGPPELKKLPAPPMPSGPPEVLEQEGTPEESANVALVRARIQAIEDNKLSAYLSTMAGDFEFLTLDNSQPVRGKDSAERVFRALRNSIGDLDTVVRNAWGVQQFAVLEYSVAGLQLAPLGRITFVPNRLFNSRVVDIFEIRNHKITRLWRYDDSGAVEPSK